MTKGWHSQFKRAKKIERTDTDGTVFHSKGELARWKKLQLWQIAGDIRNLRRQVAYELVIPGGAPILTPKGGIASYVADFVYDVRIIDTRAGAVNYVEARDMKEGRLNDWREVIEDYKGYQSRESQFKIAVFEAIYGKKVLISGKGKKAK